MHMYLVFLLSLFTACFSASAEGDGPQVDIYTLAQYQERVLKDNDTLYVVNFWATWCGPCVKEMPYFKALNKEYQDKPVKFILISLDAQANQSLVQKFIQKKNLNIETHLLAAGDPNVWINALEPSWQGSIPATFLYYKASKRSFYESAFHSKQDLVNFINNHK